VVGKGTIKRTDHQDVDERGQPYDLILPESSLKGNSPGPGEYVWDTTHLGFNAWSERCQVRLSYQYFRFYYPVKVRFVETDAQGHVFFGHYLTYFDVGLRVHARHRLQLSGSAGHGP